MSSQFHPAWWLRGAHAQTIWGRFMRRRPRLPLTTETIAGRDGEQLELISVQGRAESPRVLMLHGLEGSSKSHYVGGLFRQALSREWSATMLVFRGCGVVPNDAPRFYHSGDTADLQATFDELTARYPSARWFLLGVSLGGNVLLKWLAESAGADPRICATAAISTPYDLEAGARHLRRGWFRVYDRSFVRSLRRKAIAKLDDYPGLFDRAALANAGSIFDFDDVVTAPVHGFVDARDYYSRSSSEQFLRHIRVPTLLVSAADDPFLPREVWERVRRNLDRHPFVRTEFTDAGGHVGFISGRWPWKVRYFAEQCAFEYFDAELRVCRSRYD